MKLLDLLSLSLRTLRANRLRSAITIAIIALGITALIGIITAIGAMNQKLTESFSNMGANGFTIRFKERGGFRLGNNRQLKVARKGARQEKKSNLGRAISLQEAERFATAFTYPATLSLLCYAGNNNTLSTAKQKTNPTVALIGTDENYLDLNGVRVQHGRNLSRPEVQTGVDVCLLGSEVAAKLFGAEARAVGREVRINGNAFHVVGVLHSRGSSFGFSRDNLALVAYKSLVRYGAGGSFSIGVKAEEVSRVEEAMGEAEGTFRNIRQLAVTEENNFVLERSDSLAEKAIRSLGYLTAAVTLIGFITLIGAAIGLMNIMLVAVAERTKEVGLIKAIGGKRSAVHRQFLLEAVLISLAGALFGIALGIALGNLFALLLNTAFVVPWRWIVYGVVLCTVVGLLAGFYPAWKAGKLNPIEALRYE